MPTNHDTSSSLLLYRAGAGLARALPRPVAVALGRGIAQVFRRVGPTRRAAVRANLARLRPAADARALDRLVAATYAAFAESLIDAWRLDLRPGHGEGDAPTCTIVGAEALRALLDGGRGVVLWSAHFGNWELAAAALAREGFDVAALARPHADPGVDRFFAARRAAAGVRVVGRCPLARGARETLRARGLLALLGDRRFGGAGQAVRAVRRLGRAAGRAGGAGAAHRRGDRPRLRRAHRARPLARHLRAGARAGRHRRWPSWRARSSAASLADPTQWFVFERMWDERAGGARMSGPAPAPTALRLAVIVPAFQAAATLPAVLERLARVHPPGDTWVIDDGSRDGTGDVARAAGVHVETHAVNRGKGAGLLTGFRVTAGYDAVATLDADGQHKPEDLPRLVAALATADLVVGARVRTPAMPPHRRLGNWLSATYLTWLAGTPLPDVQSGYRIHRAVVLAALGLQSPPPRRRGAPRRRRFARPATASNRRS